MTYLRKLPIDNRQQKTATYFSSHRFPEPSLLQSAYSSLTYQKSICQEDSLLFPAFSQTAFYEQFSIISSVSSRLLLSFICIIGALVFAGIPRFSSVWLWKKINAITICVYKYFSRSVQSDCEEKEMALLLTFIKKSWFIKNWNS